MATVIDKEAVHRAILENPLDDAPRLIFADILEELGEEERANLNSTSATYKKCSTHFVRHVPR